MKHKIIMLPFLILILMVGNRMYYNSQLIEKPIFLDHYYSSDSQGINMRLMYIYNTDADKELSGLEFESDIGYFSVWFDSVQKNEFNHLSVYEAIGNLSNWPSKAVELRNPVLYFTDGSEMKLENSKFKINEHVESESAAYSSSSNTGENVDKFRSDGKITINSLKGDYLDIIDSMYTFTIMHEELHSLEKFAGLTITESGLTFEHNRRMNDTYNVITSYIVFSGKFEDGEDINFKVWFTDVPYFNEKSIKEFVDSKL